MRIPVSIRTSYTMADKKALVDSGATDNFMHPHFAARMGIGTKELPNPCKIWNIDGTMNKGGYLTHYVDLDVQTKGIHKEMRFLLTDLGGEDLILGYPWLVTFKPKVTWKTATIDTMALCHVRPCDLRDQRTCAVTSSSNSQRTSRSYRYV